MLNDLRSELKKLANPEKAKFLTRFFKTGKGEYGEGDVFLGIVVPVSRKLAVKYKALSFAEITSLLQSKVHEERLIALLILVLQFTKGDDKTKKDIYDFYLAHTKYINNWDLVDLSADKIVGEYLFQKVSKVSSVSEVSTVLKQLAKSENLWEKRIAMLATYAFIKRGKSEPALAVAAILINDNHDFIQKAVGWMLREVGNRVSQEREEAFLLEYYKTMPRTALRYAIEKFSPERRKQYLLGQV